MPIKPVSNADPASGIAHSIAHVNIRDGSGNYMKPLTLIGSWIPGAVPPPGIRAPVGKAQGANVSKAAGNAQGVALKNLLNTQGN